MTDAVAGVGLLRLLELAFQLGLILSSVSIVYRAASFLRCSALIELVRRPWDHEKFRDAYIIGAIRIVSLVSILGILRYLITPTFEDRALASTLERAPAATTFVLVYISMFCTYSLVRLLDIIRETTALVETLEDYSWCRQVFGRLGDVISVVGAPASAVRAFVFSIHRGLIS